MNQESSSRWLTLSLPITLVIVSAMVMLTGGLPNAHAQPVSPLPTPPGPTPLPTAGPSLPTPVPTAVPTVQPTPTTPPVTPLPGILGYHSVRRGETLFCIGRAYRVNPWAIASQNNIPYPYYLQVNQVLAIPNAPWGNPSWGPVCPPQFGGTPPQPTPVVPPPPPPPGGCRATYMVRRGDTLSSIAWRYGSSVWAIASRNNIANPNLIFPGQVLCIP